ncbi:MAG: 2,3-bisphosphoglycerate-independent phosphoglycerate mutase, partial [Bacteroidetes bacterium]|nr:2,3-bisphosphoglycerate-independent phosphoglycerate mutase [Bacteroidota bacterium]
MKSKKVILVIMDGWGMAEDDSVSAINFAQTPFYDNALKTYPHTLLHASETQVGLPAGQMGNSEVGHMNIGAGRIVYQDLERLNQELKTGNFAKNQEFQKLIEYCKTNQKPLHLLGLLSDGGVHSSIHHLTQILSVLADSGINKDQVFVHAFMDGRDTSPTGGEGYINDLEKAMAETGTGKIASVIGRYYSMDRDKRWERVKKAYDLLVHGTGKPSESASQAVRESYQNNITDEFIDPVVITENGKPVATINEGDAILFYNFRTDRGRQLTHVLTQQDMPDQGMKTLPLYYATM